MKIFFKILTIWMLGLFVILLVGTSLILSGINNEEGSNIKNDIEKENSENSEKIFEFDEEESGYKLLPNKNKELTYNNLIQGNVVFDELFRPAKFAIFSFISGVVIVICFIYSIKLYRKSKEEHN